jgi:hypothetical protein
VLTKVSGRGRQPGIRKQIAAELRVQADLPQARPLWPQRRQLHARWRHHRVGERHRFVRQTMRVSFAPSEHRRNIAVCQMSFRPSDDPVILYCPERAPGLY